MEIYAQQNLQHTASTRVCPARGIKQTDEEKEINTNPGPYAPKSFFYTLTLTNSVARVK